MDASDANRVGLESRAGRGTSACTGSHREGRGRGPLGLIFDQISDVLEPLAVDLRGCPEDTIRPVVAHAWHRAFGSTLNDSALGDTAAAIHDGRSWTEALWTDAQYR